MKISRWAVQFLLGAALALKLGCGGAGTSRPDDAGQDGGALPLGTLQNAWCPILAERFCAAAPRCGCTDVPGFTDAPCLERAERGCRAQLETFADRVASGALEAASTIPEGCMPALEMALADCRMPAADLFAVSCPLVWPTGVSRELPAAGARCSQGLCAQEARCSSANVCESPMSASSCQNDADCLFSERSVYLSRQRP